MHVIKDACVTEIVSVMQEMMRRRGEEVEKGRRRKREGWLEGGDDRRITREGRCREREREKRFLPLV